MTENSTEIKYQELIKKILKDKDIYKTNFNYELSKNINHPLISLGFHHLIHQNKDKMEVILDFKNRKKVYLVTNEFERYIDEYKDDLDGATKVYFNLKKEKILSRAFFKLWEILINFKLIDPNNKNFVSAHLAEGPGSFIQSTIFFRDKFSKFSKKDKYHAITLHSEEDHVPPLHKEFINRYKKEKPIRLFQHKTYTLKQSGGFNDKDNGDLTNPKTIKLFGGSFKEKKADFITADGGFNWKNENTQEQEAFKLILSQIIMALKIQNTKGSFVCKLFESYTINTVKIILVLNTFYENVFITKPFTSRKSNSERYVVCQNFIYKDNDKEKKSKIEKLDKLLEDLFKNNDHFVIDFFNDYELSNDIRKLFIDINNEISNKQLIAINQITGFINGKNYYGDLYNKYRDNQIKAANFWINKFYVKNI
jgi:23S rRNA U2552 (ribose-2'-O)-methylase RlmE/FtsJ